MPTRAHRTAAVRFPPFPPILDVVTRAFEDPALDDRKVVQAIRTDEALTLGLLRYANSAWMARRHAVASVGEALTVVGLAGLRSVVLTQFSRSFFQHWDPIEEFLWEHALASAIATALQHPGAGRATEDLYLCGLLHNVGKAVLNAEQPAAYAEVVRRVVERGEEFSEAERLVLGVPHPTVATDLLREGRLPAIVEETARQHHYPRPQPEPVATACRLVAIADAIAYQVSSAWARLCQPGEQPVWVHRRLETVGAEAAHLASRVSGEVARLRAVLPG